MGPEPGVFSRRLQEPVVLPGWGTAFLAVMAASVVAQLLLITLSVARMLPHLRVFLNSAYLVLFLHWGFGALGCLAFLALFGQAFRRPKRLHLALLGLSAFAVLLHGFLNFAFQLLFSSTASLLPGLGRSLWALLQPGHATSFLTLGVELMRLAGAAPFSNFWQVLRLAQLLDAGAVAVLYLLLWIRSGAVKTDGAPPAGSV